MKLDAFLDVRTYGFARVGLIIPRVQLANPSANARNHLEMLQKTRDEGAEYVIAPELGITGYSCQNLFFQEVLLRAAEDALSQLLGETRDWGMLISVGMPIAVEDAIYNCAVSFFNGRILSVVPKSYLPEYREFREKLWFAMARDASFKHVELLGQKVPFGTKILLGHVSLPNFLIHEEVCEDGWVPVPPSSLAALGGAFVLSNLSASNITVGKASYRVRNLAEASSGSNIAARLYVSAGFGESTTDLAWDGHGIIAERGEVVAQTERFSLEPSYLVHDVNLDQLATDRRVQSSFRDNATEMRTQFRRGAFKFRRIPFGEQGVKVSNVVYHQFKARISPNPFVPAQSAELHDRCEEVFHIQATSLARRIDYLPPGTKVIEGLSGGSDSTQALLVAVRAMDLLRRPRRDIICLTMPGFGTTDRTKLNAITLANCFGVTLREIPITAQGEGDPPGIVEKLLGLIGHDGITEDLAFENSQSWCRKIIELATGAKEGGLVLGTGDLSELAQGYCTMFGDHASHYGVNAGVAKTLIRFLIEWAANNVFAGETAVRAALVDVLETPISAELLRPSGEQILQVTEERIGPYDLQDFHLFWGVRFGTRPSKIARMALDAYDGRYDLSAIVKWQKSFWRRFFASQYKRNCLPDGPKVGLVCLSPRGDWRMPSDADPNAWLADLDGISV